MRGVAFVALLGSLSASAATVDIPLDFGADFAAKTSSVRRVKMDGLAPGADFEAWFETDLPVDAHWFGTYLRKGGDRFSLRQSRHFSPAQWKSSPGRREGLVRVSYFGKVPAAGRLDLAFVCDHGRNFMRPTEDDMRALAASPHPRLIIRDSGVFARVKAASATNEVLAAALDHMRRYADYVMERPLYAYRLDGRRLWAQPVLARVFGLGQTWKISGERRYLDRLESELRTVAAYPDWNESHFIDTGLMTAAFAVAYDWFYDDWSAEMRDVLADAIVRHGLEKAEPGAFWVHNGNNWAQVCHAGMTMGSVALAERCPELARRLISQAVETYHEALDAYAPAGCFPEGPGYWHLATMWTVLEIETFRSAFGTDFGLASGPGFLGGPDFINAMTGPTGRLYSYSDSGSRRVPLPEMWWFARECGRPDLIGGVERTVTLEAMRGPVGDLADADARHSCDCCFVPLAWMVDAPRPVDAEPASFWSSGECCSPVVMASAPAGGNASGRLWVAMKGGSASLSHAHADLGSFVFEVLGERWAEDAGGENYGLGEKKFGMRFWKNDSLQSPRWSFFRLGPHGHNLVTVDAANPDFNSYAGLGRTAGGDGSARTCEIDLSLAYPVAKRGAVRRMTVPSGDADEYWRLEDEFRGVPPGTVFTWRMNTCAEAEAEGRTVHLSKNGKTVDVEAESGEWIVAKPDLSGQTPAPDLRQLQLRVAAEGADAAIRVRFRPGPRASELHCPRGRGLLK